MPIADEVNVNEKDIEKLVKIYKRAYKDTLDTIISSPLLNNDHRLQVLSQIRQILKDLKVKSDDFVEPYIKKAYNDGFQDATEQLLENELLNTRGFSLIHKQAVNALVSETQLAFGESMSGVYRSASLLMNQVVKEQIQARIAEGTITGSTRKEIAKKVKSELLDQGLSALVDKGGKRWSLDRYADMLVRTKAVEARNTALANKMLENGFDLVEISNHSSTHEECARWEGKIVSLTGRTKGYPTLDDSREGGSGIFHPNCFLGDTLVSGFRPKAVSSRWYDGKIIVIKTSRGKKISVTPNHPILTTNGWVASGKIAKGDNLFYSRVCEGDNSRMNPDYNKVPTTFENLFNSLVKSSGVFSTRMPVTTKDFHGDGIINSDVNIVFKNSFLLNNIFIRKFFNNLIFILTYIRRIFFSAFSSSNKLLGWNFRARSSNISFFSKISSFFSRHLPHSVFSSLTGVSKLDSFVFKQTRNGSHIASSDLSNFLYGETRLIGLDNVIGVEVQDFVGHVYNLENDNNWYVANSIIAHNCKHAINIINPKLAEFTKAYNPEN